MALVCPSFLLSTFFNLLQNEGMGKKMFVECKQKCLYVHKMIGWMRQVAHKCIIAIGGWILEIDANKQDSKFYYYLNFPIRWILLYFLYLNLNGHDQEGQKLPRHENFLIFKFFFWKNFPFILKKILKFIATSLN